MIFSKLAHIFILVINTANLEGFQVVYLLGREGGWGGDRRRYRVLYTIICNEYVGKILESTKDLKTSACTMAAQPPPSIALALKDVPYAITSK